MRRVITLFFSLFTLIQLSSQDSLHIGNIGFSGNIKTKDYIIYREIELEVGDELTINTLEQEIIEIEKRLLSTGLFTHVKNELVIDSLSAQANVHFVLQENWYIFPSIIFSLADRNFNVWWKEQNRSLDRVNLGLRLNHINLTGNRDNLKLTAQGGYTKRFEWEYGIPYINKKKTLGIAASVFYSENKELGYKTVGNKTVFFSASDERIVLKRFRIATWLNYRQGLYNFHWVKLDFHKNSIDQFVASELNPDYFLNGDSVLKFLKLEYDYTLDRRIFSFYPEGGHLLGLNIKKEGLGIFKDYNNLILEIRGEKYFKLTNRVILACLAKANTNIIRSKVAFANNTGLGYNGNVVSGYELYVLDGTDFLLNKSAIRIKLVDQLLNLGKYMPLSQFKLLNIELYLSFNLDTAYVNEPTYQLGNPLNNQWIIGYGPGLDLLLFNQFLFSIEYSFNELGESGLFIGNRISF